MDRRITGAAMPRAVLPPLIVGLLAWGALASAWPRLAPDNPDGLTVLGYALTAAVFVSAGGVQLVRARITGQAVLRWSALALLAAGSAIVLLGALSALARSAPPGLPRPAPLTWALVVLPTLVPLGVGTRIRVPAAGPAISRTLAALVAVYALVGLVLSVPGVRAAMRHDDRSALWLVLGVTAIAGWALLAVRTAERDHGPYSSWRALAFALTAANGIGYTIGLRIDTGLADRVAAGFALAAAATALAAAGGGLKITLAEASRRALHLDADLDRARERLAQAAERDAERRHDARTAALGVEAAVTELGTPALAGIVRAELDRLIGLLDGSASPGPLRPFALGDALVPVLAAQRLAGLALRADPDELAYRVLGRPAATAGVLANLLTNATRHAPGATVWVRALRAGHTVSVVVDDDGPGIPAAELATVALRGTRGADPVAPGSGLGLYTAARAMAEQGGTLHVTERPGGGTRVVLTLPVAASYGLAAVS